MPGRGEYDLVAETPLAGRFPGSDVWPSTAVADDDKKRPAPRGTGLDHGSRSNGRPGYFSMWAKIGWMTPCCSIFAATSGVGDAIIAWAAAKS